MIQRIQSVYLLIVFVLNIFTFFFPLANFFDHSGNLYQLVFKGITLYSKTGWILFQTNYVISTFLTIILILSLICIFLYSNRSLQMKICLYLMIGLFMISAYVFIEYEIAIYKYRFIHSYLSLASLIPLISIIIIYLAFKAIKKDDNLVKSADRLR